MFPVSVRVGTEITVVVGTVCAFDDICSHNIYICMPQDILTVALEGDNWSLTVIIHICHMCIVINLYSHHRPDLEYGVNHIELSDNAAYNVTSRGKDIYLEKDYEYVATSDNKIVTALTSN